VVFVPISPELSSAFGTPISVRGVPSAATLNPGLERAILARAHRGEANRISNVGGWQSLPDLLDWPEAEIKLLAQEVDRAIQQISTLPAMLARQPEPPPPVKYSAYGWANVNRPGDYNLIHLHPGNQWSVVYYVATGTPNPDTPMNGRIELRDPRPAAIYARMPGFTCGQPILIKPQAGMMLVFPAWIEHGVHPFHGEGNRISIAINVAIEGATGSPI
jgi:uncharacterized protein (TIGR02466 family)